MKDYTVRAFRTFLQAFLGQVMSVGLFNSVAETGVFPGFSIWSQFLLMAAGSGIVAVLSFTQNYLEQTKNLTIMPK